MTRKRYSGDQQVDPVAGAIAVVLFVIILLWIYVINPAIIWITQLVNSTISWLSSNSTEIIYGIVISAVIVAILYILSAKAKKRHEEEQRAREKKLEEERRIFEEGQRAKGLIKFTDRFIKEKWGTPQEVELWKNLDYEEAQKDKGFVKFTDKYGNTTWKSPEQMQKLEKEQFEEQQNEKGLVKFVDRFKSEKWGTLQQVETWEKEDREAELKESLFYRVVESIEEFQPKRRYKNEFGYHNELLGWLQRPFPNVEAEKQTGSSRPDIVIDNIAIEVKGLANNRDLDTLSTKIMKYTNHYPYLVFVLFDSCFSEPHYDEILKGIERSFPDNVKIIRKD